MPNLNLKTGVGYKPLYHKGDVNDIARRRASSRSMPLSEQGRRNWDAIWGEAGNIGSHSVTGKGCSGIIGAGASRGHLKKV